MPSCGNTNSKLTVQRFLKGSETYAYGSNCAQRVYLMEK